MVQIVTALAVTFINMATQWKFQAIDHFSHWVKDMKLFLFYLLVIVTIGGSRCAARLLQGTLQSTARCTGWGLLVSGWGSMAGMHGAEHVDESGHSTAHQVYRPCLLMTLMSSSLSSLNRFSRQV